MQNTLSIPKTPRLLPSEDYHFLRQKGMDYIQALGSKLWTDYNIHDPGITTLELMCFAITDLGYRTGFDTKDIFAKYLTTSELEKQAFFPAHEILVNNPLTIEDYRKLLIDQIGVQNAWLIPKVCHCDEITTATDTCDDDCNEGLTFYSDARLKALSYSKLNEKNEVNEKVSVRGLYDVLLEFENDPIYGDINDGRVYQTLVSADVNAKSYKANLELRLPTYSRIIKEYDFYQNLLIKNGANYLEITKIELIELKNADGVIVSDANIEKSLRKALLLKLKITFSDASILEINDAILNIYFLKKGELKTNDLKVAIESITGIVKTYKKNVERVDVLIQETRNNLHRHRNLDEDFFQVALVPMEDVSVCVDIELRPDADIEQVQAQILVAIEQYLNPIIPIYTLNQMLQEGYLVEDIFQGPLLENGFIKAEDLQKTALKREIHASDMINFIMEIEGVTNVANFLMTSYDEKGTPIYHSQAWVLPITRGYQPRLYLERSKIMFYKNGLPFLAANAGELNATLQQLRGGFEQIKAIGADNKLPIPQGEIRDFEDYFPVQHSYPMTYGIGKEGLSDNVPNLRKAQAQQLKAYLLFFEQILLNYLAQLQNAGDLFLTDATAKKSYFSKILNELDIVGLYDGLNSNTLQDLVEKENEGLNRRNRFLDHLLARFGESFSEYATMLYSELKIGKQKGQEDLLKAKSSFLKTYATGSKNRGKGIDYELIDPCQAADNYAGLQVRIAGLLDLTSKDEVTIVEHLLLRPRLLGQLFLPICIDENCNTCYDNDPYSFRLTIVAPGWVERHMDLDFRRFAERTVRLETPSHLLPKVCWVGNEICKGTLLCDLKDKIWEVQTQTSKDADADKVKACLSANELIEKLDEEYRKAIAAKNNKILQGTDLEIFINKFVLKKDIKVGLEDTKFQEIKTYLTDYWKPNTACYVYAQFKTAWCEWLKENSKLQPKDLQLAKKIKNQMKKDLPNLNEKELCEAAHAVVTFFGEIIRVWVEKNHQTGLQKTAFDTEINNVLINIANLSNASKSNIKNILQQFYNADRLLLLEKHANLIAIMSRMKSIYPPATLHDCEDGNDENPVRLGATVLG